jgi:hypothetical protein
MAQKKTDDKHLKILRQLLTLPENRQCVECSTQVDPLAR